MRLYNLSFFESGVIGSSRLAKNIDFLFQSDAYKLVKMSPDGVNPLIFEYKHIATGLVVSISCMHGEGEMHNSMEILEREGEQSSKAELGIEIMQGLFPRIEF